MRERKTIKGIILVLFSTVVIGFILNQAPISRGSACLSFTCNAAGSGLMYYGEEDQPVHFEATFASNDYTTNVYLNLSWDNGANWETPLLAQHSITYYTWYYDLGALVNPESVGTNATGLFCFRYGSANITPIITIQIADAYAPANATNVALSLQSGGRVLITWNAGLLNYDYGGGPGWATDNVELNHWDIYRSTDGITYSPITEAQNIAPTTFQYTDTPPSDVKYYYRVFALDRAGHISAAHVQKFITPDRTIPTPLTYTINGTSYLDSNKRVDVPSGGILNLKFTISENVAGVTGKLIMTTTYNGNPIQVEYTLNCNETSQFFWLDLESVPVGAEELRLGVYDVTLEFTDSAGNQYSKQYVGQISVYVPNPFLEALMWIVPVAVGALVAGYVATKKIKQRRLANLQKVDAPGAKKRKGQIFKGASDLGRASGDEAEVILAKRKRAEAEAESKPRTKAKEGGSKVGRETPPSLSSAAPSSFEAAPVKAERFDTISATASTKEVRALEKSQMIDPSKKVGFIEGRVTNLENVMSIAVNLVEMIPEAPPCDKCGKPLNPSWSSCPWCRVTAQSDELEMKLAISGMDGAKMNVCPTCRAPLNPAWSKCPYCATRKV